MKNQFTGVEPTIRHTQRAITCHPPTSGGRLKKQKQPAQDFVREFPLADIHLLLDSMDLFMTYISKYCGLTAVSPRPLLDVVSVFEQRNGALWEL